MYITFNSIFVSINDWYRNQSISIVFNLQERFAPELKYDVALRLAALHIHQHVVANNGPNAKVTIKAVE